MAIRSNTKAARAAIREYIAKVLVERSDELNPLYETGGTLEDMCAEYVAYLNRVLSDRRYYRTDADRIAQDMNSGGPWELCTYERARLVGAWLHETEAEIDAWYERGKADEMFCNLITREILTLARR